MSWPPAQQNVAPPMQVQQVAPQTGYSYDPSQVPLPPQQQAAPYYPGQPAPPFQQQAVQQPQGYQQQMAPLAQQPSYPQGLPQTQYMNNPQQPQQQQRAQLTSDFVLDGPGVEPELRGRTVGDAMRLYKALSTDFLMRQRSQTPAGQSLAAQGLNSTQPGGVGQVQGQLPAQPFQQQPAAPQAQFQQQLQQAVQQAVQPMLQPVIQQSQTQAIMSARQQAMQQIPDYQYLEADILQNLAGSAPEVLANPTMWQLAANAARGAKVISGQYQPQRQQPQVPGQNGRQQVGPGIAAPAGPAPYQFFTESPSAPSAMVGGYGVGGAKTPTQEDQFYARQFNMQLGEYMAWKYGQAQVPQQLGSF